MIGGRSIGRYHQAANSIERYTWAGNGDSTMKLMERDVLPGWRKYESEDKNSRDIRDLDNAGTNMVPD